MNKYLELKQKHQKEVNDFPIMFAFSQSQFDEGMKKLGLNPEDTDKIYSIGAGGYIRKNDSKSFEKLFERHEIEFNKEIENDITGEGFIYEMFVYELNNHEYNYTYDLEPTLDALGITLEQINNNKNLLNGLRLAKEYVSGQDLYY